MIKVRFLVEVKVTQTYLVEFEGTWHDDPGYAARRRIKGKAIRQIRKNHNLDENAEVSAEIYQEIVTE